MSINDIEVFPLKVREIQDFVDNYLGEKITLTINRGEETLKISLVPRVSPPEGEGSLGVALTRTAVQKYPWYIAPWQGFLTAGRLTIAIANGYAMAIKNIFLGAPSGVEMIGPVGVFNALAQTQQLGVTYFLNFLALICLYLAVFNLLPIPALDGGKVAFLIIEAIRKKPVSEKIEEKITLASFALLLLMMVWVTVKDVVNLF
jgi:regulator of sigma E protease